jgi:hypothetical protein
MAGGEQVTPSECPHCLDIQLERAAIHEFDGEATREQADELAAGERCLEHQVEDDLIDWDTRVTNPARRPSKSLLMEFVMGGKRKPKIEVEL